MTQARIAFTTCADSESGAALAKQIVERRVVACVNIVPTIRSVYRWQGKIEDDSECLLVMKTTADRVEDLKSAIAELHSYDVPELIVFPVEAGAQAYLDWIESETRVAS